LSARRRARILELVEHLGDTTRRLDELQVGDLALHASFDLSLQALSESRDPVDQIAAHAFGLLSLPDSPDIGIPAAAQLIDQPQATALTALERLVDVQLIDAPEPGRYRFHDLVRLFARDCAAHRYPEPERLAALSRLIGFHTATAMAHPGTPGRRGARPRCARDA
jgi:hypothetical protein